MNLREQIEKEITDKVMTKLASEKVELGLIDDSIKLYKKGLSTFDNASKVRQEAARQYIDAKDEFDTAIKTIEKTQKAVKDLGLPMPSELKTAFEDSKRLSKLSDTFVKELR